MGFLSLNEIVPGKKGDKHLSIVSVIDGIGANSDENII